MCPLFANARFEKSRCMSNEFMKHYRGKFIGLLSWNDFDGFMSMLGKETPSDWYIYHLDETPPENVTTTEDWQPFLSRTAAYIRDKHKEDYCGVVYVDDKQNPSMVKIFDPGNLGVSCGFSDQPPLPAWVLSRLPPVDLVEATRSEVTPWWQRFKSLVTNKQ